MRPAPVGQAVGHAHPHAVLRCARSTACAIACTETYRPSPRSPSSTHTASWSRTMRIRGSAVARPLAQPGHDQGQHPDPVRRPPAGRPPPSAPPPAHPHALARPRRRPHPRWSAPNHRGEHEPHYSQPSPFIADGRLSPAQTELLRAHTGVLPKSAGLQPLRPAAAECPPPTPSRSAPIPSRRARSPIHARGLRRSVQLAHDPVHARLELIDGRHRADVEGEKRHVPGWRARWTRSPSSPPLSSAAPGWRAAQHLDQQRQAVSLVVRQGQQRTFLREPARVGRRAALCVDQPAVRHRFAQRLGANTFVAATRLVAISRKTISSSPAGAAQAIGLVPSPWPPRR